MDPSSLPPATAAKALALLAEERLDASYLAFVARHLDQPDDGWRWCCGSNCDPCVRRLASVVDRLRQALCTAPATPAGDPRPA